MEARDPEAGAVRLPPGGSGDEGRRRGGCLVPLATTAAFYFVLRDFATTPVAAVLAPLGAALACGGIYLALGGARHLFAGPQYAALFVIGLAMIAGAGATLLPAAPGGVLAAWAPGWEQLGRRVGALGEAIEAGDVGLAHKLARRGLGDPAALDSSGNPVLHRARGAEMVGALLDAGLDPDAADPAGRTLLMRSSDVAVARLLLAAGADPNARTQHGFTPLMHRGDDAAELVELLLEAGADVHATNEAGRTVADLVRGPGRALLERHAGGRPLLETGGVTPRGREDWLVRAAGAAGRHDASALTLEGDPIQPGEVGMVSVVVDNPTSRDRVVELRAVLDSGVLFVGASHAGQVETGRPPGPTSTVRWPWLALPAGGQGRLQLEVLARPDRAVADLVAGGFGIDVSVIDLPAREERVLGLYQERAGEPAYADLTDPLRFFAAFLPTALVALGWFLLVRRRRGESTTRRLDRVARGAALAIVLVCVALAGDLVGSMAEPYLRFEETDCEILDHRVLGSLVEGSRRGRGTTGSTRPTIQPHPLAAVAVRTGGERRITAGWNAGLATRSVQELRAFPIGSTATCWIDPEDPDRFSLVRSPSLGALIGVGLCLAIALPLGFVATRLGRRRAATSEGADG